MSPKRVNRSSASKSLRGFETWLGKHHAKSGVVWLKFARKDSGTRSVTYAEAIDRARTPVHRGLTAMPDAPELAEARVSLTTLP
jgi:hypothetical protein